jgi:predicted O-methyltransferase YrrM
MNTDATVDRQTRREQMAARMNREVGSRRRFDYDRSLLVNDVLRQAEEGVSSLREAMEHSGLSMGYPSWNLLYYTLLCSMPRRSPVVIEAGTNRGFSTTVLAQAVTDGGRGGVVHTVDIDPDVVDVARETVARAGVDGPVVFHVGDSVDVLRSLAAAHDTFDFVLLDGSHDRDQVVEEFSIVHPRTAAHSIVYFDNTASEGVAEALAHIRASYPGNLVQFPNCSWWPRGNVLWQRRT